MSEMKRQAAARESQFVLILDDDVMVTEGLAAGLEREGRTIVTCNDVESAELIVERLQPSHIVADVRISGPFGFEGLDFIRFAKRFAPESRVILISGDGTAALQLEASERGAVAFLQKPFAIEELDATLDLLTCSALSSAGEAKPLIRVPLLDEVLTSGGLHPLFQPIVTLDPRPAIVGYEALARFHSDSPLRNPDLLFQYAVRKHRVADLEVACITAALREGAPLAESASLFLNIHPDVFAADSQLRDVLCSESQRRRVPLDRIVLEITEQGSLVGSGIVRACVNELRALGIRFAFDDVGVAYSHLPLIDEVRPSYLKVSQHFGTAFERDTTRTKLVTNLLSLARDFDCELILEGVEDRSTALAAANLGIPLGQGFYFGVPAEASTYR